MALDQITDANFEEKVLQNSKPVLVDFWAEWCGPCRMLAPVIEAVATSHSDKLDVVKMDTDANPSTPQQLEITGLPTCILFKDGKELTRIIGFRSQDALEEEIESALG